MQNPHKRVTLLLGQMQKEQGEPHHQHMPSPSKGCPQKHPTLSPSSPKVTCEDIWWKEWETIPLLLNTIGNINWKGQKYAYSSESRVSAQHTNDAEAFTADDRPWEMNVSNKTSYEFLWSLDHGVWQFCSNLFGTFLHTVQRFLDCFEVIIIKV